MPALEKRLRLRLAGGEAGLDYERCFLAGPHVMSSSSAACSVMRSSGSIDSVVEPGLAGAAYPLSQAAGQPRMGADEANAYIVVLAYSAVRTRSRGAARMRASCQGRFPPDPMTACSSNDLLPRRLWPHPATSDRIRLQATTSR